MSDRDFGGHWAVFRVRPATLVDKPILDLWDEDEAVRFATNDDHASDDWLNGEDYWTHELSMQSEVYAYQIGEVCENANPVDAGHWRPFAAMQIIDPHLEPTHYWGEIEPNLRALDIWIGDAKDRNRGWGGWLMRDAVHKCFSDPKVTAIIIDPLNTNTRAHKFYQCMGFVPTHRQTFNNGEDDCLVHRLTREQWLARQDRPSGDLP